MTYLPNSLVGRLTVTDNRLRGLIGKLGVPTVRLAQWNLDGVVTPKFQVRVSTMGEPVNRKYLEAAINSNLVVSDETLVIKDIPRQVAGAAVSEEILRYGIVELFDTIAPLLVKDRAEVLFLDKSKLTTYTVHAAPYRNR